MIIGIDVRASLEPFGGIAEYTRSLVENLIALAEGHDLVLFSNSRTARPSIVIPPSAAHRVSCAYLRVPNKIFNASLMLSGRPFIDEAIQRKKQLRPNMDGVKAHRR